MMSNTPVKPSAPPTHQECNKCYQEADIRTLKKCYNVNCLSYLCNKSDCRIKCNKCPERTCEDHEIKCVNCKEFVCINHGNIKCSTASCNNYVCTNCQYQSEYIKQCKTCMQNYCRNCLNGKFCKKCVCANRGCNKTTSESHIYCTDCGCKYCNYNNVIIDGHDVCNNCKCTEHACFNHKLSDMYCKICGCQYCSGRNLKKSGSNSCDDCKCIKCGKKPKLGNGVEYCIDCGCALCDYKNYVTSTNAKYCDNCTCAGGDCANPIIKGKMFCESHLCKICSDGYALRIQSNITCCTHNCIDNVCVGYKLNRMPCMCYECVCKKCEMVEKIPNKNYCNRCICSGCNTDKRMFGSSYCDKCKCQYKYCQNNTKDCSQHACQCPKYKAHIRTGVCGNLCNPRKPACDEHICKKCNSKTTYSTDSLYCGDCGCSMCYFNNVKLDKLHKCLNCSKKRCIKCNSDTMPNIGNQRYCYNCGCQKCLSNEQVGDKRCRDCMCVLCGKFGQMTQSIYCHTCGCHTCDKKKTDCKLHNCDICGKNNRCNEYCCRCHKCNEPKTNKGVSYCDKCKCQYPNCNALATSNGYCCKNHYEPYTCSHCNYTNKLIDKKTFCDECACSSCKDKVRKPDCKYCDNCACSICGLYCTNPYCDGCKCVICGNNPRINTLVTICSNCANCN
jgi:hypothetical protein